MAAAAPVTAAAPVQQLSGLILTEQRCQLEAEICSLTGSRHAGAG
jgi:hypothetical protein